jgi:UPF0755 protein
MSEREKAKPVAVGPSRHRRTRAARKKEQRTRRRRRWAGSFAAGLLVVVVVAAVFLGAKLWHVFSGNKDDYTGPGRRDPDPGR